MTAPQRFLANNRNIFREAAITPSLVQAIANAVLELPLARSGTAQAALTGSYTGDEEAIYDVEIVDTTVASKSITAPIFSGAGSGSLSDVGVTTAPAQTFTVELADAGIAVAYAGVDLEGVALRARTAGTTGNLVTISIDQSPLTFTPTAYSLLADLEAGTGGETSGLEGPAFDWQSAVLGPDNLIPSTAKRIAFGDDHTVIYLQYKQYADGKWTYHFVPEIARTVQKGTPVYFVTGGREVTITDGSSPVESYTGIVTLYDLLSAIKEESALVDVSGVVANDRSPTGQAARELLTRTDAYAGATSGSGSSYATSLEDVTVESDASTELVTITCSAVSSTDHALAHLGAERWNVTGSLSGDLGTAITGVAFAADKFGFTIPQKLPPEYSGAKGRFDVSSKSYATRGDGDPAEPPICVVAMTLGASAVDQTITLEYTARPSGDCLCESMAVPNLSGPCLGTVGAGGDSVTYQTDTIERLKSLYDWWADTVRTASGFNSLVYVGDAKEAAFLKVPVVYDSLSFIVEQFETTIALIDPLTGGSPSLRTDGMDAWDTAFAEIQTDVTTFMAASSPPDFPNGFPSDRYASRLQWVLITAGISPLGKSDASIQESGDGCWRDYPAEGYYWTVVGSGGAYAPAFNNQPYYSSRRASNGARYFSTHEFAFQLNIKCPDDLREGDRITLDISDAAWGSTYQNGDVLTLPIIAAQPLALTGGQDGSETQTWFVSGDVSGALPSFLYNSGSPVSYDEDGLQFTLNEGGVPFETGDEFTFAVVGGHFRWRATLAGVVGSWSSSIDITTAPIVIDEGLSLTFTHGVSPSLVAADVFRFRALQPWAATNMRTPTRYRWQYGTPSPDTADVVFDCGSAVLCTTVGFALHTLPTTATLTLEGGDTPGVYTWSEAITVRSGPFFQVLSTPRTNRYFRLTVVDAEGGGIGWTWAGDPWAPELSADIVVRRDFRVDRTGSTERATYLGKTKSGTVEWTEGALTEADATALAALLDHVKENDDESLIIVPQVSRETDVLLVKILVDEVEFPEISSYNRDAAFDRRYSARLPLQGVWRS